MFIGAADVPFDVTSGPQGVLLRPDPERQNCWFGSWLAQDPAATNFELIRLERATSVADALAVAPEIGIPHQNLDRRRPRGAHRMDHRRANSGRHRCGSLAQSQRVDERADIIRNYWIRRRGESGPPTRESLPIRARPHLIGADLATLGAEYDLAARVRQIRDDLLSLTAPATPADMLRIQLDDRALFLQRWHDLLLQLLDADALAQHPGRAEFRTRAADMERPREHRFCRVSAGAWVPRPHGALRMEHAHWRVEDSERDRLTIPDQFEHALWLLVTQQPMHLLDARYASWRDFLLDQLDQTIGNLQRACGTLSQCTWGLRNTIAIRHPLSAALPLIGGLLDMPTVQLPGDNNMPRVQDGDEGASERFAVSPGHENEGYFHMPGGQSGHPLSPYYRAGFLAWAHGEPLPFLPGPAEHTLTLQGN